MTTSLVAPFPALPSRHAVRHGRPRRRFARYRRRRRLVADLAALIAALLLACVLAIGWVGGWRAHVMVTASMGRVAPVGTLVLSQQVAAGSVRTGEIVVFHPPGQPRTTFVHRVVAVRGTGPGQTFTTRGDLSGAPDPWTLTARQLVGRASLRIRAVGWLVTMAPWLAAGGLVVLLLAALTTAEARRVVHILGFTLVVIVAVYHYRPLVGMELVTSGASGHGAQATVVPTGILPVEVRTVQHAAGHAVLLPGQVGTVRATALNADRYVRILATPHLMGWWWLLLATWPLPLVAGLCQRRGDAE